MAALSVDPSLEEELKSIRNSSEPIQYMLAVFEESTSSKQANLKLLKRSNNENMESMQSLVPQNDICYGLIHTCFTFESVGKVKADTWKTILLLWRPDEIPVRRKMMMGVLEGKIKQLFSPFHVTMEASSSSDLTQDKLMSLLDNVTMRGSNAIDALAESTRKSLNVSKPLPKVNASNSSYIGSFLPSKQNVDKQPASSQNESKHIRSYSVNEGTAATTSERRPSFSRKISNEVCVKCDSEEVFSQTLKDIRAETSPIQWAIFRYTDNKTISMHATGTGTVDEMMIHLDEGTIEYGFCRVVETIDMSETQKFCFLVWQPESALPMKKSLVSTHQGTIREMFRPYQFDFFLTHKSDMSDVILRQSISSITGSTSKTLTPITSKPSTKGSNSLQFNNKVDMINLLATFHKGKQEGAWILLRIENMNTLTFHKEGQGGIEEMINEMCDTTFYYGLIQLIHQMDTKTKANKFCFVQYQPDSVPPLARGKLGMYAGTIQTLFEPYHGTFLTYEKNEITKEALLKSF